MSLSELPTEILTAIVIYATANAPTRQKRRKELLSLARTCKSFGQVCLRQIYNKLAYEISLKGLKLLSTLKKAHHGPKYASMVHALAIRERESGVARKPINSREGATSVADSSIAGAAGDAITGTGASTRAKKMALQAIVLEERRITELLLLVEAGLVELKYETNLLPEDDLAFSRLQSLQRLSMVPQPPYPDVLARESMLDVAQFTLTLPIDIFRPALVQLDSLTHLDLWRCSFPAFEKVASTTQDKPRFRLQRLGLEECKIAGATLQWLVESTISAQSLVDLQLGFLTESTSLHADKHSSLAEAVRRLLHSVGPHLQSLSFETDGNELEEEIVAPGGDEPQSIDLVFTRLGPLKQLSLSGRGITERHWASIPYPTLSSIKSLHLHFTPKLAPTTLVNSLRNTDAAQSQLTHVSLKGSEDFKRRNLRELLHADAVQDAAEWIWTKEDFITFVSLAVSREIQYVADRTIVVGDEDEEESEGSSEDGGFFGVGADDQADFVVTQEQWEMEKAIEAEELERTFESGSEY